MAAIFVYKTMKRQPSLCTKTNPMGIEHFSTLDTKIPELTIFVFFLSLNAAVSVERETCRRLKTSLALSPFLHELIYTCKGFCE